MHLNHFTIRTEHLEQTRDFLLKVFDELREGVRPSPIAENIPGHWLYAGDDPLIHLIAASEAHERGPSRAREAYDHVGIFMKHYDAFLAKLRTLHVPYSLMDLPEINERRIFLHTPSGILIETVFRD